MCAKRNRQRHGPIGKKLYCVSCTVLREVVTTQLNAIKYLCDSKGVTATGIVEFKPKKKKNDRTI